MALSHTKEYVKAYNRMKYEQAHPGAKRYMRPVEPCEPVSPYDLAWAAGFFEGEGSFDADGRAGRIGVPQVNREPVERLLRLFGGTIYQRQPERGNLINTWMVRGPKARHLMEQVYPLMSQRRQRQIENALLTILG